MDKGQQMQASIKEEVSEPSGGSHRKKESSRGGNILIAHADQKETRRRGARRDLNGPRTYSEEPNLCGATT